MKIGKTGVILLTLCMALTGLGLGGCGDKDKVKVVCPSGRVELCDEGVTEYLNAGYGAYVGHYSVYGDTCGAPVEILWGTNMKNVLGYTVEYATKKDFSDKIALEFPADREWCELYNLYKDTKYYVRVWAHNGKTKQYAKSSFTTTARGPRVMTIDGIYNTRDCGGYVAADGKKVRQGMVYRGTALNDEEFAIAITRNGKKFMKEQMGIRSEISLLGGNDGMSAIDPSVPMYAFHVSGYEQAFVPTVSSEHDYTPQFRALFKRLADPNTYPTYIHCQGGADRTGTVCYLLGALLGVQTRDLVYDYEFTSFSTLPIIGIRNTVAVNEDNEDDVRYRDYFRALNEKLNAFEGSDLKEKTENYLLDIGVTAEEIASIRKILLV